MQKKIYISDLEQGQRVEECFLVARKSLMETKAGKPYLALGLMDKTGEIEARLWDNALQYDGEAEVGDVVLVQAVAKSYRESLQLGLGALRRVSVEEIGLEHFMPASSRPLEEMERELLQVIDDIGDAHLKSLLKEIFKGETLARFVRAPAAKKMHHAYIGGLVEHTLSIVGMAGKTADHYSMLNKDLLVVGVLLHDIAKIREFEFSSLPFDYTDSGRLVGHLVLGAEMVRKAAEKIKGIDQGLVDQIIHMVLSHHGQLEYGSPVLPMTPEAMLLHHLDDMDAKMNYMERLAEGLPESGLQWTDYQRPLERFLYLRGKSGRDGEQAQTAVVKAPAKEPRRVPLKNSEAEKRQQSLF